MAKVLSVKRPLSMMRFAIVIACVLFIVSGNVYSDSSSQEQAKAKVAQEFLDVAQVKYEKGLYDSADKMLDQLQAEYAEVLAPKDKIRLKGLKQDIANARVQISEAGQKLAELKKCISEKEYVKAEQILNEVSGGQYLTAEQQEMITANSAAIENGVREQQNEMKHLFHQSINEYKAGNFESALKGFTTVKASGVEVSSWGKDCDYFIAKASEAKTEVVKKAEVKAPEVVKSCKVKTCDVSVEEKAAVKKVKSINVACDASPVKQNEEVKLVKNEQQMSDSYISVIESKRRRQVDYTRAVVNNSILQAEDYISKCEFAKARSSLTIAYANIEKTRMLLGDTVYCSYKNRLDQLNARINQCQEQKAVAEAEVQRVETQALQENIRRNMEEQRRKAVHDYMQNALAFQKEQRYEEALAQIEALLTVDPQNHMALIQKQTLKDIIVWREQNSIQKEKYEQELQTLLNADRAGVPYADEMVFPKNWKELIGRRKSDNQLAVDPANYAIYRQLDKIVDLSSLTEDSTFAETVEIIRTSVDPELTMIVMWRDLEENAYIDQSTPINISFPAPVKLKSALELILESVAGGFAEIDYAVKDGIIRVATTETLPDKTEVRQYDVSELLGVQASFSFDLDTSDLGNQGEGRGGGGGGGGRSSGTDDRMGGGELMTAARQKADDIMQLIQDSIDPESWYDAGGDASIKLFSQNKLIVRQTVENHEKIEQLLEGLRSSLGQQVAIEARFIIVTENFLERLGIDMDFSQDMGSKWGRWNVLQNSADNTTHSSTGVPGSLADNIASSISGQYGTILDDLQVRFLISAIQSHRDARTLNAPKVSVLSGESAAIRVITDKSYVSDYDFEEITSSGDNQPIRVIADPEIASLSDGVFLNVSPTITADKKYVLLRIETSFTTTTFADFLVPSGGETSTEFPIQLPESEVADVRTRVTVPDGGTLLIGGQKLTGEVNKEEGIPIVSKIPLLGRLFENRSEVKDSSILLVLVKPTIMLQNELEEDAIASMK